MTQLDIDDQLIKHWVWKPVRHCVFSLCRSEEIVQPCRRWSSANII